MWTRSELKTKAKADIKICYWKAVLASIVLTFCAGGSTGSAGGSNNSESGDIFNSLTDGELIAVVGIILAAVGIAMIITLALKIFVLNPFVVGGHKFFADGTDENGASLAALVYAFKNNYMNQVFVIFMRNLFISLWSLLFIIPGVVKAYQYRMVPYILGEDPDISYKEALEMSKDMMDGNKWNAFVLDLSFILWYLLSGITFGLVYIFYVGPYVNFTNAELYMALKNNNY